MNFHIYAPQPTRAEIGPTKTCPDCGRRTRMIQLHTEWHGWDSTCMKCGRSWMDGEWMALPFTPESRQQSIDNAKAKFRRIKNAPSDTRPKGA